MTGFLRNLAGLFSRQDHLKMLHPVCLELGRCPACEGAFADHRIAYVATKIYRKDDGTGVADFLGRVRAHEWAAVEQARSWDPKANALTILALSCPSTQLVVLVVTWDPFELFRTMEILEVETMSPAEGDRLVRHVSENQWKPCES